MLKPASDRWSLVAFFVMAYGFAIGIVWIGSRASISALVNMPSTPELLHLIDLYDFRYESLLQVTRVAVLALSIIFVARAQPLPALGRAAESHTVDRGEFRGLRVDTWAWQIPHANRTECGVLYFVLNIISNRHQKRTLNR